MGRKSEDGGLMVRWKNVDFAYDRVRLKCKLTNPDSARGKKIVLSWRQMCVDRKGIAVGQLFSLETTASNIHKNELFKVNNMKHFVSPNLYVCAKDSSPAFATCSSLVECHKVEYKILFSSDETKQSSFHLGDVNLQRVQEGKDLGVTISSNLSWDLHVKRIVSKAYRILGLF